MSGRTTRKYCRESHPPLKSYKNASFILACKSVNYSLNNPPELFIFDTGTSPTVHPLRLPGRPHPNGAHSPLSYSALKLFTGFIKAAFSDWKLTVNSVISRMPTPAAAKIHQDMAAR